MNATWNALRQINLFINANFEQGAAPWTTRDNAGIESTGKNGHVSITAMQGVDPTVAQTIVGLGEGKYLFALSARSGRFNDPSNVGGKIFVAETLVHRFSLGPLHTPYNYAGIFQVYPLPPPRPAAGETFTLHATLDGAYHEWAIDEMLLVRLEPGAGGELIRNGDFSTPNAGEWIFEKASILSNGSVNLVKLEYGGHLAQRLSPAGDQEYLIHAGRYLLQFDLTGESHAGSTGRVSVFLDGEEQRPVVDFALDTVPIIHQALVLELSPKAASAREVELRISKLVPDPMPEQPSAWLIDNVSFVWLGP